MPDNEPESVADARKLYYGLSHHHRELIESLLEILPVMQEKIEEWEEHLPGTSGVASPMFDGLITTVEKMRENEIVRYQAHKVLMESERVDAIADFQDNFNALRELKDKGAE